MKQWQQVFSCTGRLTVEIEEIAVDGKSIIVGEPFAAADDWLKSLTVRVRNISGQRLVRVQITLVLPEMNAQSPDIVFCYGCAAAEKEKGLMPGSDAQQLREFTDVRELQRQLKDRGVNMILEADENSTGPASFMIADPDGNTILVDQHV